jgi:hypothetical protein
MLKDLPTTSNPQPLLRTRISPFADRLEFMGTDAVRNKQGKWKIFGIMLLKASEQPQPLTFD